MRIRRILRIHTSAEEGFTLIELVIAIAIMGIIVVAIVGTLFAFLRNANDAMTRATESADQQFVSAYWQQDVSSLGSHTAAASGSVPYSTTGSIWTAGGSVPANVPVGCQSIPNTVAGFVWNDYQKASATDGTATWIVANNAAVYFTQTSANGKQTELWRTRCVGTATPQTNVLARFLTGTPDVTCSPTCSGQPNTVSIKLVVQDLGVAQHNAAAGGTGYTTVITADRRQG